MRLGQLKFSSIFCLIYSNFWPIIFHAQSKLFICWRQTRTGWIKSWLRRFGHGYKPMTHGVQYFWSTNIAALDYQIRYTICHTMMGIESGHASFSTRPSGLYSNNNLELLKDYLFRKHGCLPFRKSFRKTWLDSKRNTTSWVVPGENCEEQPKIWKGSPVFPDGMHQTIRAPFLRQNHLW